jgi:hypothetical protein
MKLVIKKSFYLELTEDEAQWLAGVMQNPLRDYKDLSEEPTRDASMRKKIFDALTDEKAYRKFNSD